MDGVYFEKMRKIQGKLRIIAYDRRGRELWNMEQSNLIVDGAYQINAEALAGVADSRLSKVAAGTNGTAPAAGDTAITDPTVVDIQTVEYPQAGTVRFNFTLGYYDAVGVSIREFGLLSADGRLFARKIREQPIEKTKYMSIVGVWEITI